MTRSRRAWTRPARSSRSGASKVLACELPRDPGLPLSRYSIPDLKREALRRGLVASIGETTLWRWLDEDAIRRWRHRSWIFPRDPEFEPMAGRILDLYEGTWEGRRLTARDFVISTDERTSIQARRRIHGTRPPRPGEPMRVEQEYERKGAWAYLAAWDVRRAKVFGRCEPTTGIAPFGRLVAQVVRQEPYRSAQRVFWIMDNGSSHRGRKADGRLRLGRPAQGAHAERPSFACEAAGSPASIPPPVRAGGTALPVEVHPTRPEYVIKLSGRST